jgi:protein-L-isoaspartate O-methyltransferase
MIQDVWQDCHLDGGMSRYAMRNDPKRIAFTAARYLHTAKLLAGKDRVLEVGCADGFGARIVRQHVCSLTAIDLDPKAIAEARASTVPEWPIRFEQGDIMDGPMFGFDAAYALDVLEHVPQEHEHDFLANLVASAPVAVIGMPSLESQVYASEQSKAGHVNCKTGEDLRGTLQRYYEHVFMLCMNDGALHTGHFGMAHYLLAVCAEPAKVPTFSPIMEAWRRNRMGKRKTPNA